MSDVYIRLAKGEVKVAKTEDIYGGMVLIDWDENGGVIGVEVLGAVKVEVSDE